jgi:outer membrane protein OmpA-like peptidoglycan-associated protein
MKKVISWIFLTAISVLCTAYIASAEDCKNAEEMLNWAVSKQPDAMTEEYIKTAIKQCPSRSSYYKRAGAYYMHWYKKELNPNSKKEYKTLAIEFYREGAKRGSGKSASQMRSKQASLEKRKEWSREGFRALTPVPPDSRGKGLWLKISFELDSYRLTKSAQKNLDELGRELAARGSLKISLQGHTDMFGSTEYNKDLSMRRAKSAKKYLMEVYNISSERIVTLGFGFERLADAQDPYNSVNRRVEVLKIAQ